MYQEATHLMKIQKNIGQITKIYVDLETTGVDSKIHGIHQIASIIEVDGEVKEKFNFKCKPFKDQMISPQALAIAGITKDDLRTDAYEYPIDVYNKLTYILGGYIEKFERKDKAFFVGYNASFDNQFLREFFNNCKDKYFGSWFWSGTIDVMTLALEDLIHVRHELPNFKLATVAKHYGIEFSDENLHNAMFDIELTRKIYQKIRKV